MKFFTTQLLFGAAVLVANSSLADLAGDAASGLQGRRVSLTRSVEPSFRAEPVVHRFQGRRGEVLPFAFELASTGKVMNVDIRPISLRQEESGIILHDEHSPPMEGVRFTSPLQFQLTPGETFRIEGEVTVPLAKTNYMSFGILVRDRGQISDSPEGDLSEGSTRAAIRFVTQYVLRVDIETGAQDVGDMDQLSFQTAELIDRDGLPEVRAFLNNPTDYALECQVRATLRTPGDDKSGPIRLHMPSRSELPDEERYLVRIMPNSRLRLEGRVDGVVNPGDYDVNVQLSNGRRTMVEKAFPASVAANSFRALQSRVANLASGLSITPAQIELGRVDGTDRTQTLQLTNSSETVQTVQLIPRSHDGEPLESIMLSSKKFTVKPGRTKSIRAMLRGKSEHPNQWGSIDVVVDKSPAEKPLSKSLAVSLVHSERAALELKSTELQWAQLPTGNAFVISVTNHGQGYAPIDGLLMLAAESGHPLKLTDGYGKWLPPGKTQELQFQVPSTLEAGSYQLRLDVRSGPDHVIDQRTLVLEITPEMLGATDLASR